MKKKVSWLGLIETTKKLYQSLFEQGYLNTKVAETQVSSVKINGFGWISLFNSVHRTTDRDSCLGPVFYTHHIWI
jgi:hypothetical protein